MRVLAWCVLVAIVAAFAWGAYVAAGRSLREMAVALLWTVGIIAAFLAAMALLGWSVIVAFGILP